MTRAAQQRLTDAGPKRILALDGGGVRGIVSIAFLERIERLLAEATGRGADFRLSDYFDLIGGTSVGSMLATMLAMGDSVAEVRERFERWAPEIFRGRDTLIGVKTFDARQLINRIRGVLGTRRSSTRTG
jgi:patatin-like phospholipase/acyl hydrolase